MAIKIAREKHTKMQNAILKRPEEEQVRFEEEAGRQPGLHLGQEVSDDVGKVELEAETNSVISQLPLLIVPSE